MESIEQGREQRAMRPGVRLALIGAIVAVLALGALAWVLDTQWRARTADELTRAFDETVTAIESGERRVSSMMEYARPARDRLDVDPDVRTSLDDLVRETAIEEAAGIADARARIDSITILPWHDELINAREEADTWLALRATGITSLAEQGRAVYPPQGELDDARAALVGAFSALR
jgi:hypothetical protein